MLGIDEILRAEPAADIGRDKAHLVPLDTERARRKVARRVDALRRDVGRIAAGCPIVESDDATRLHRIGHNAMVVDAQTNNVRRRRRGSASLSRHPGEAQIARRFGGNLRRPRGARCSRIDDRRQRRVIDHHMFGGVERRVAAGGDDERHRLPDIAHLVRRQERLRRKRERLAGLGIGRDVG